jgi:hypothetical protein
MTRTPELALTEKALAAMRAAVNAVIEDHRRRGKPLVVCRDGKVVYEMPSALHEVREHSGDYDSLVSHRPEDSA